MSGDLPIILFDFEMSDLARNAWQSPMNASGSHASANNASTAWSQSGGQGLANRNEKAPGGPLPQKQALSSTMAGGASTDQSSLAAQISPSPARVSEWIQLKNTPKETAEEIATEMGADTSTPVRIQFYADVLQAVPTTWASFAELQASVVRALFQPIMDANGAPQRQLNCGTLLAHLFSNQFIAGNAYEVSEQLVGQNLTKVSQFAAVFNIVKQTVIAPTKDASKAAAAAQAAASFWRKVCELTANHPIPEVRFACSAELQGLCSAMFCPSNSPGSPQSFNFPSSGSSDSSNSTTPMTTNGTPLDGDTERSGTSNNAVSQASDSSGNRKQHQSRGNGHNSNSSGNNSGTPSKPQQSASKTNGESAFLQTAVMRTVFVTNLSRDMSVAALRKEFDSFGTVLKIRVCVGSTSLMGYVEVHTVDDANRMLSAAVFHVNGVRCEFRRVKQAISGSTPQDAKVREDGTINRDCQFGREQGAESRTIGDLVDSRSRKNHAK